MRPYIIILIDNDIKRIKFNIRKGHYTKFLFEIYNPILLIDDEKISKSDKNYNYIYTLLGRNTIIKFHNIRILWNEPVWPPSIDSLLFAKKLREMNYLQRNIKLIADMGCGTGFLGLYLAKNNKNIRRVYAVDINPLALKLTEYNFKINGLHKKVQTILSNGFENLKISKKLDLIICNPPYIPLPDFCIKDYKNKTISFAGIDLLKEILLNSSKYTKELIILYSNLSLKKVQNIKIKNINERKIIMTKEIPFRIPFIIQNKKWLNYLLKNGLKIKKKSYYKYWHKIIIERIVYQ